MSDSAAIRPLSDRHHPVPEPTNRFEVRVVRARAGAAGDSDWRTIACCGEYDDAVQVATALVADDGPWTYAEVWGPDAEQADGSGHRGVRARFPTPSHEEARQMWLQAAEENYGDSYSDLKH